MRSSSLVSRRTIVALDVLVVLWIMAWTITGALVGYEVSRLRSLSNTLEKSSAALDQTAGGLDELSNVPFVGGRIGHISEQVKATSTSAKENAVETRHTIDTLDWLLAVVIVVIPSLLVLVFYLPYRVRWSGDRRDLRAAVRDPARRRAVEEFLARRAVDTWSFRNLRRVTLHPWHDVEHGDYVALAAAHLRRLGIANDAP